MPINNVKITERILKRLSFQVTSRQGSYQFVIIKREKEREGNMCRAEAGVNIGIQELLSLPPLCDISRITWAVNMSL